MSVLFEKAALDRLSLMIDGVVWQGDPATGSSTYVSEKITALLGYTPQQWMSNPHFWESSIHPDDRAQTLADLERFTRTGEPFALEYRACRADGRVVWLRDVTTPLVEDGRLVALGGVMLDITAQKQAEAGLRAARDRFEKVFAASPVGIALTGLYSGRVMDANDAFLDIIGLPRDAFVGSTNDTLNPWMDLSDRERLVRAIQAGPVREFEARLRHVPTGEARDVLMSTEALELEGEEVILILTQDVTERRRAEAAAQANEQRFRAMVQHSSDLLTIVTRGGYLKYASPSLQTLLGYEQDALIGRNVMEFIHPDDQAAARTAFMPVAEGETGATGQHASRYRQRNGEYCWMEWVATNHILDPHVGGIVMNSRDVTARMAAEEAVKASERRFRTLVHNSSDIITIINRGGFITYTSPSVHALLGQGGPWDVGAKVLDFMHPDEHDEIRAVFAQVVAGGAGATARNTNRFLHADGTYRSVEWEITNHVDNPDVRGIVMNSRDVTARLEAEAALRASERRFRTLVQNSSDIVTIVNRGGYVTYISPPVETLLGHVGSWMIGTDVLEFMHPDEHDEIRSAFTRVVEGGPGTTARMTNRFLHDNGTYRWMEWVATNHLHDPDVRGVVMNTRDVSERKAIEDALEESRRTFEVLFDESPDSIMLVAFDGDMPIVNCNEVAARMKGYAREELIGQSTYIALPNRDELLADPHANDAFRAQVRAEGRLHFESDLVRKDGSIFPVDIHLVLLNLGGREMLLSVERDITERRATDAALRASQARLLASEKLAGLGRLTAGLAHEINTPLASTLNELHEAARLAQEYRDSIGAPGVNDDDHREIASELAAAVDAATRNTTRIGDFIRKMRSHTRDTVTGRQTFDAVKSVNDTLTMLAHEARSANVSLLFEQPRDAVQLTGEPGRFTQVITNLVVNAIHACSSGASVTVRFGTHEGVPTVEVQDTGSGIAPDVLPRIFEPMFTTKDVGQGTGLGLSIIHDIVTGHFGGDIHVTTTLGAGTTFTVHFPEAAPPA
ncbi:PAS domain-containing protein [Deinococcus maricopensis]|uniref:histidine kinase n=1 Tax=Deinococcus maricopensis (strain DSM 21211 / LMG 22137 / NRRL B-23946 / LB-34) TaxID=709986 RepID=E8U4C9_DEIML|nr:PAS domain S-box protein [Deinococcus maricopensis]ADV65966.1 PAS/PAC sensor signal transduction histidine kinase [Deinococcus maricopensis DSM 21211]